VAAPAPDPLILLVSGEQLDVMVEQFHRYDREYDVRSAASAAEATALLEQARAAGQPVALVATESRLPDT